MTSQSKLAPLIGKAGLQNARSRSRQDQEIATVEIDLTLARLLGLTDGVKV